ncbi:tRNA-dihydrouridine synthase [Jannaschia pagri]|uniref:tRNA-dihydrouridine synthase n=2 Tax=Roseobacteraceae TaxID=2854170 RepID=A0ABQ4NND8_9RHOB|nr:tRNA-dihydrouridine synthase [Jannaschia sp. AI_61]GIT95916.1 tRNA-dihydrouridine synthase [Jannaschia sp. AI_62]
MAGITDLPFRKLVQRFGAGLVVSEMVASREMVQAKRSVRDRAEIGARVEGTSVQIAGREAHWMAEAARMLEGQGARIIDINMGCPAKKVVGGASGSALLRDHDHAMTLIEAVVGAVSVPVTLKTRLGWDEDSLNTASLAARAEAAGIRMLTIHGRTRCQFYKGQADWDAVGEIVDAVSIPVLVNGDITDATRARQALAASGAAGVMIGRGVQGRPWICASVAADLLGTGAPQRPTSSDLVALICGYYEDMIAFYGPTGARSARKHLGWYMDDASTPAPLRREVLTAPPEAVPSLLADALSSPERQAA